GYGAQTFIDRTADLGRPTHGRLYIQARLLTWQPNARSKGVTTLLWSCTPTRRVARFVSTDQRNQAQNCVNSTVPQQSDRATVNTFNSLSTQSGFARQKYGFHRTTSAQNSSDHAQ